MTDAPSPVPHRSDAPRESATSDRVTSADIQRAAATGVIRGRGIERTLPHFDDLLFLGVPMSRYPPEGCRERCDTDVVLGDLGGTYPLHLGIPVTIAAMPCGALSAQAKEALGRGASEVGTSTTTGAGGMTPEERGQSNHVVYQYRPSRYGTNPTDLRRADAIEIVLEQRRHPDRTGPDELAITILELREITYWEKPIYVKIGASRTHHDVTLAVAAGADVVVVDGSPGGTATTRNVFIENVGVPVLAAIPQAVQALRELGLHRKVQLIVSGGIRTGADVAKAMALGADAVAIGTAALIALRDNDPQHQDEHEKIGSAAGFHDDFLDPVEGGRRLADYLRVLTMEAQTIARACGKAHLQHLEPEDLVALTIEAAAMARVRLAGTSRFPRTER